MNFNGIIIGGITFLIIGLFHPIVIKSEYYFSKRIWPVFLLLGILFLIASIKTSHSILSPSLGVIGFSCLWSIHEIWEQEQRVAKGWFPKNPKR